MSTDPPLTALDPQLVWEASAIHDALHDLVQRQPTCLRDIITVRYGLDGCPTAFYREMGEGLHLSGERVRQLHTEALVTLRHPAHSQRLRSLLGYHTVANYLESPTNARVGFQVLRVYNIHTRVVAIGRFRGHLCDHLRGKRLWTSLP